MTALEFIHKHQNDEDNGECLILPDGSVEEPLPSHIGRLVELTGMDAGALHGRMEKNMEPLFWLVEYTGCMSVWQTRVVAPTVPTGQQQAARLPPAVPAQRPPGCGGSQGTSGRPAGIAPR